MNSMCLGKKYCFEILGNYIETNAGCQSLGERPPGREIAELQRGGKVLDFI